MKRIFLKYLSTGLVIVVLVSLCACREPASTPVPAPSPTPAPTPTPVPTPSPTPTPTPSGTPVQALPAKFEVSLLSISPTIVPVNQPVTFTVAVNNIGGTEGAYSLTMTVDGIKVETKVIRVAPESTEKVSFVLITDKPGIHKVGINGVSVTFQVLKPADFTTSNLVINPTVAEVGQTVTATVEISNIGEIEGSYPATLKVASVQIEDKDIAVPSGVTETASFTFTRDAPGCYEIEVAGLTGLLIVIEPGGTLVELLKTTWPELFQELQQLPELKEIDTKDNEAIEDITYLALNPEYRSAFESMLTVGIKDKRKYCTPLQALLWIAYESEFDKYNPLEDYSLRKPIMTAWKYTAKSQCFESDKWQNFDEVVDRLNSPELISFYMMENIVYKKHGREHFQAKKTFELRSGPCSWQAAFAFHCLAKNGYVYDDFSNHEDNAACILAAYEGTSLTWDGRAHVTCLYKADGTFYLINSGRIQGPFDTIEQAATRTWKDWDYYELRDVNGGITKKVKRVT